MNHCWRVSAFGDEIARDLEEQLAALRFEQIAYVEVRASWGVNVVDLDSRRLNKVSSHLRTAGIGVSAIASPVGKAAITGDFELERRRLRSAVRVAECLSTNLVRVFSFFVPAGSYQQHRDEVLRRMSSFAREAAGHGITLVHENESYIYGDNAERCLDLIESVGSPALRLAFDPANFVQVGVKPFSDAWPLLGEHVAHFHVKDAVAVDRTGYEPYPASVPDQRLMLSIRPAGEGDGELREMLAALDCSGYQGFLTLEPHLSERLPDRGGADRLTVAHHALRQLVDTV
jgi:sugar phosphate isomerase/epimerase